MKNSPKDDFDREAELYGLKERPPYALEAAETAYQRDLSRRSIESYKYGLEEVDVWQHFEGFTHPQIFHTAMSTESLMLSSFCRGQCAECGLCAKPYGKNNRKIFALEPLIRFLEKYKVGAGLGKVMLYDASDPLDYPYLLQLLDYLEWDENFREVKVLTSCPRGTEELLEQLLQRRSEKLQLAVSQLPSTAGRLQKSGVLKLIAEDTRRRMEEEPFGWAGVAHRIKDGEPKAVGRYRGKGRLDDGFNCGDLTILTPHLGPVCGEYHIASDLYPTERRLIPVREARRVYLHNPFFSVQFNRGFAMADAEPKLYTPHSSYVDLDTGEWQHSEVALRHLAAFIYHTLVNMTDCKRYHSGMEQSLAEIQTALKNSTFVLPDDPKELAFYRKLIPELLNASPGMSDSFEEGVFRTGFVEIGGHSTKKYNELWGTIRKMVEEFKDRILGEEAK